MTLLIKDHDVGLHQLSVDANDIALFFTRFLRLGLSGYWRSKNKYAQNQQTVIER